MTGSLKSMDREEEEEEEKSQSSIPNKIHVKAISNDAYTTHTHTHTPRYDGTSITNVHNECPIIDDQKKKKSDDDGVWCCVV